MMNRYQRLIFLLKMSSLFLPSVVFSSFCRCQPKDYQDFRLYVAPQVARVKLRIEKFSVFRGVMEGGSINFEYRPFCNFYAGAFAEWMMGDCSSAMGMSRYLHDLDGQVRGGYSFPMWNYYNLTFTPFFGLGYIEMVHHIRPDASVGSFKFNYGNYYLPFGVIIDFKLTKHFAFGFLAEKRKTINQRLRTPYIQGARFALDNAWGYLLEVPFMLRFGQKAKFELSLIPYLKREVDGSLNAKLPNESILTMPSQDYRFWGLRLGFGARF